MIQKVTVVNFKGEQVEMVLNRPETSGFIIKSIDGLGPPSATVNTTELSVNENGNLSDGSLYNSAKVYDRNIVINIKFMEKPSVEANRLKSYRYFPIKREVKVLVETDSRKCFTTGYVESNEPNIFSEDEDTQISILCPDPYFYENANSIIIFYGVNGLFEFPFSNEGSDPVIEFGEIKNNTAESIYYQGDFEIGYTIYLHAVGQVTNITLYDVLKRETMKIDSSKIEKLTGSGIVSGDDIIISSVKNNKYISLLRNGIYTNILSCLDKNADWFVLTHGENIIAYTRDYGTTNLQFRVEYRSAYEGV